MTTKIVAHEWKDGGWHSNSTVFYRRASISHMSLEEQRAFCLRLLEGGWIVRIHESYIYWGS